MYNKYIICFLILSIINFSGCYSLEVINKEDVDEGRAEINLSQELFLTTKDSTRYHFLPPNFSIANDTLYGKGTIQDSSSIIPFQGSVALDEIINFEQNKADSGATLGLIAGIIAVGALVLGIIAAVAMGDAFSPN